ncbi:L-lactate dehydrogenase (cytochrome) [Noviherbaspirillum humi]|uniref:L-lactate dehydrogenase (Cytochrome) n=1 Tax=Noviherbaspirillum humi TaxID=1688639 RepID=A0A239KRX1_9BURK|nr:L-lactate dehydrogenase [Noviherbaspirillum humi]SNT20418.1 L-lactate dehydrogenase (cytochrome) [Noviherbaspirillum humi]
MTPASIEDYRTLARQRLPRALFDYIDGGSYDEITLAANRADLRTLRLRQRVMWNVEHLDTSTELLGQRLALPLALAPVGFAGMMARRGEVQAARAAVAAGIPFSLSTLSVCSIEEVSKAINAPFWFQLYMMRDRGIVRELLQRAQSARCSALFITVDLAAYGMRYREVRHSVGSSFRLGRLAAKALNALAHLHWTRDVALGGRPLVFGNLAGSIPNARTMSELSAWVNRQLDPSVTWKDLVWVRENWRGPLIIKGIMDPDDARAAHDIGADAVVVSNHGGRQLDCAPSTISALPAIADAVGDRLQVLMDGGVRSGQDVAKALALGARAVLFGRPWAWALAAGGEKAVGAMLATVKRELESTMALQGLTGIAQIDRRALQSAWSPEQARAA